jgi:hypothetical protein
MRIDSSGAVRIGHTDAIGNASADNLVIGTGSGNNGLSIYSGNDSQGRIDFRDTTGTSDGQGIIFYQHTTDSLQIHTNSAERMRIDSSGRVGIGDTSPDAPLVVRGPASAPHTVLRVNSQSESTKFSVQTVQDSDVRVGTVSNHPLALYSNSLERMRIDSSGRVGIGATSMQYLLDIHGASGNSKLNLQRTNSADNGNAYGSIFFSNSAGNSNASVRAHRESSEDNAYLAFQTSSGGTLAERMRIESTGNLQIARNKYIGTVASGQSSINIGTSGGAQIGFHHVNTNDDELRFYTHTSGSSHAERMRIDRAGRVNINTTSAISAGLVNIKYDRTIFHGLNLQRTTSGTGNNLSFLNSSASFVGSITSTDSATAYNTSSDYRLKENAVAISDGITRLKTLKPYKFNWIVDETNTLVDGFFAHEVSNAVPEAVTGTKDQIATDSDNGFTKGDPIYQQIDQSKLVPLLVAALQEAVARIEALEAK